MTDLLSYAAAAYAWAIANPEIAGPALTLIVLTVYSYVPRTPPADPTLFRLWCVLERLTFMSWERWGGPLKWFGIVSPDPDTWASEAPTRKEPRP